jgi:putative transcriptional regulator
MIRVNLDVMMARRKIRLTDLAAAIGISMQNLSVLKTGKARAIRFSTLDALCRALDCQPGDIIEYDDTQPQSDPPDDSGRAA